MASFGLDWPYPVSWLALGCALYVFLLVWHARRLFRATKPSKPGGSPFYAVSVLYFYYFFWCVHLWITLRLILMQYGSYQ